MTETYLITRDRLPLGEGPYPLGRNVHHDSRSRRYPFRAAADARRVTTVSHHRHVDIFDQGDLGSCTGQAALGCLGTGIFFDTLRRRFEDSITDEWTQEEAVEIYSLATTLDPWPGSWPPEDTGSDGLSVAKVAQSRGYVSGYEHAFGLDQALQALMSRPVITGTNWYNNFFFPDATTGEIKVRASGDTVVGGHEFVVDGYNADTGMLVCANSWGPGWGRGGRFTMHRDLWARLLREQGDVTVFVPLTLPEPEPEPEPDVDLLDYAGAVEAFARTIEGWRHSRWPQFGANGARRKVDNYLRSLGR